MNDAWEELEGLEPEEQQKTIKACKRLAYRQWQYWVSSILIVFSFMFILTSICKYMGISVMFGIGFGALFSGFLVEKIHVREAKKYLDEFL